MLKNVCIMVMVKERIKCKIDSKLLRITKRGKSHFAFTWAGLKYCIGL